jgi:hypothetical protein
MAVLCAGLLMTVAPAGQSPSDTTEPSVWITSPGEDQAVPGTVEITAEASDASGVAGVIFEVDGEAIAPEDVDAPWGVLWNATASGPGSHILTVIARDTVGNAVRSAVVPVVVGGSAPPPPPPPTNHSPTAATDSLTSVGRAAVTFTGASLLANDSDEDGHSVSLTLVAEASSEGGTIVSNGGGSYTYTPAAEFAGIDIFTYTIADGFGGSATGTVNVNVTAPAASGLVLSLGFDENMGLTAFDGSGGNRNGTIKGPERVSGKIGGALRFDGADDWVTVADAAALDLTTGMTIGAWVQPLALSGWETVVMKERGANDMAYALYAHDGAPLAGGAAVPAGYVRAGGAHQPIRGAAALALGAWTHLATTYDGATLRLYVNGSLVSSRAQTGLIAVSGGALRIGGNNSFAGEFFTGLIDEVRVYNRALPQADIQADMAGGEVSEPPANTSPVATADSLVTTVGAAVSFTSASLLANDSDPDGDAVSIADVATVSAAGASIASTGAGSWTYTPPSAAGADSFAYTISDGHGGSATGTVNVTVNAAPPPPPPPPPPGSGLVLALGFNEAVGATTTSDASGLGNHGTVREAKFVAGKFGNGLSFDGVNDWVTVVDGVVGSSLDLTTGMTLEAWVFPTAMSWGTVIMKQRGTGDASYGLYAHEGVVVNGGFPAPAGFVKTGGAFQLSHGASALPMNAWTHIATTYDGITQRFFVNGVEVGSRPQTGNIAVGNQQLRIGGNNAWGGEFFTGLIDEVRVYNRALSLDQVKADMTTPIP